VVVLGDQLDLDGAALAGLDPRLDRVWMAEVREEATHVWSHKARIALFLAAMRHFRDALRRRGVPVEYRQIGRHPHDSLATALAADVRRLGPARLVVAEPGDWRVREALQAVSRDTEVPLEIRRDTHFLCPSDKFGQWAAGRRTHRLEHFYRLSLIHI
jgi:deoxyribodipyrimidine photolyase-related protein